MTHQDRCDLSRKQAAGDRRDWDEATALDDAACTCIDTDVDRNMRVIEALEADNDRLRAVIAEGMHQKYMTNLCPWCKQAIDGIDDEHESDCMAFTPDGTVK